MDTDKVISTHGFRATLKGFAISHGYDSTMIEVALAHTHADKVLEAYLRRGALLDMHRKMLTEWADHCQPGMGVMSA